MKRTLVLSLLLLLVACGGNTANQDELKATLMKTMNDFLYKSVNYDSSKVKYYVKDVIYYDDAIKNQYECEFKVLMKVPGTKDTVGKMSAYISKDFKNVNRYY